MVQFRNTITIPARYRVLLKSTSYPRLYIKYKTCEYVQHTTKPIATISTVFMVLVLATWNLSVLEPLSILESIRLDRTQTIRP